MMAFIVFPNKSSKLTNTRQHQFKISRSAYRAAFSTGHQPNISQVLFGPVELTHFPVIGPRVRTDDCNNDSTIDIIL